MPNHETKPSVDRHQLEQIVAGLKAGVLLIDPAGPIVWANPAALAMHGSELLADLGTTAMDYNKRFVLHDSDQRKLSARDYPVARMLAGEVFTGLVVELMRHGERERVLELSSLVLTNDHDEPESLVLVIDDVTEQFDAEERFERTFEANPAPALILGLHDSRYIKVNRGFLDMTGYNKEDVVDRPLRELDVLRHAEHHDEAIRALDEHTTIAQQESLVRMKNGDDKFVIVAGQPIQMHGEPCMLFTFNDLHARKQAEISLRQSEERFTKAFRLAPVPMVLCRHKSWTILEINDAFESTLGHTRGEVAGQRVTDAGLGDEASLREWSLALEDTHSIRHREEPLLVGDGVTLDGLMSAELVTIQDEPCVLLVVQDITQRKRTETEMVAAIDAVMKDASWFSRSLMEKLAEIRRPGTTKGGLDMLTARELEVLEGICKGWTDAEIASSLGLSRNTVRNYVANLYDKIAVNRRSAAVVWGRERGLGSD